jgi:hypothetical protein
MAAFETPGTPAGKEVDIEGDISKRITADFGVTIAETWTQVHTPGAPTMAGFNDLVTTFQYQVLKDGPHELTLMVGLPAPLESWSPQARLPTRHR